MSHAADDDGTDEGGTDDADETADWLTGALHMAFLSDASLDYSFSRDAEWLLLRRVAYRENPEVIAEYPIDHDPYHMVQLALATIETDIARRKSPKRYDGDPSVYRHGL